MPQTLPVLTSVPEVVSGYPLDGQWEVIAPIARTNEVLNPSFETNTTGYTAGAGALARSTLKQYHGAYSAQYTPSAALNDGFFYGTISTTAQQFRAISCKWLGQPNIPYALTLATTGGVDLVTYVFRATGRWQWLWLYWLETSTTTRRIYFRKNGSADVHPYYIDGVQSEVINTGESVSTYIDGDQQGFLPNQFPVPYGWNGTAHASSSYRSAQTRAGGYVLPFKKYGFILLAMIGLGTPQAQNVNTDYAQIDGGYPNFTRKPIGQFTLTGNVSENTYGQLRASRSRLGQLFDRDVAALDQPLLLRYAHADRCDNISSDQAAIPCKYVTGWEGQTNNSYAQVITMTFETYLPSIFAAGQAGVALNVQTSIASLANGMLQRSPAGVWSSVGNFTIGFSALTAVRGLDGLVYIGGDFTPAPGSKVVVLNPVTGVISALGTGAAGGDVFNLVVMPNGDVIASGSFTSMGGVANTNRIARWSISAQAWQSISSAFVGTEIRTMTVDSSGLLYVGGVFTSIGGVASTNVHSYNGTIWVAVAAIAAGGVSALAASGTVIYAAVENTNVQKLVAGAWTNIGTVTGGGADPQALAVDARGFLYAAGDFTAIGGVSANYIAVYNGTAWAPLGTGLNASVSRGGISFDQRQLLYVGGTFTTAGSITTPSGAAVWNGSSWVYPDVIPTAAAVVFGSLSMPNGQFFLETRNAGSAIAAGTTTITNTGTAPAYPMIVIRGPSSGTSRIYSIVNPTTGKSIYLNLTINAGETIIMDFQPDALSFISDFQGDVTSSILAGSDEATFFLQPAVNGLGGANTVAFFAAASTVAATLVYTPSYLSLDDIP